MKFHIVQVGEDVNKICDLYKKFVDLFYSFNNLSE